MPRRIAPSTALPLFEHRPTSQEAWELVTRFPVGCRLALETVKSHGGKYENGPYWFAYVPRGEGQRPKRVYIGSVDKKRDIELAWEVVGEELAAAAASPAVQRLRDLEKRAGMSKRGLARTSADVVDVPILKLPRARPK